MLRNKEFQQVAILFSLMGITVIILSFTINKTAGILSLVSVLAFGIVFFVFTKARYKNIAQIAEQIDLILHNENHLYLGDFDEGELSILHSEITKMTSRIREQNYSLQKDKEHLADLLADITHQLRTPLTSATLILSLLANTHDEKQRKAYVRETEELLLRMDWLITSLLKLSRLDAGIVAFQREQMYVNDLIHSALRPFLIPMELHNIEVPLDIPTGILIQGDLGWLSEALQNILKNCIENVDDNGTVEIVCTDTPLFTEIAIHDNGTGFDAEDLPCLFDRFHRGKGQSSTGYGIGLALCKRIITQQGGTITARNHLNGGAVFAIRFPK